MQRVSPNSLTLSVVIPTYNAAAHLPRLLKQISRADRIVVADGGSQDSTAIDAMKGGAVLALGAKGRGPQLALGASWASGADWLLFIHADNQLPPNWRENVERHIAKHPDSAGYFRYRADDRGFWTRFMDFWVAMRCQWWGLPYGDQGLLISRAMYDALGGYGDMVLFEDVDVIDRIKAKFGRTKLRPLAGHMRVDVSKYAAKGIWSTGRRNLRLLKDYRAGVDIETLRQRYRG